MPKKQHSNASTKVVGSQAAPISVRTNVAARLLGVSPMTLRNWRAKGVGPRFVHVSGPNSPVLYLYQDLLDWANRLHG